MSVLTTMVAAIGEGMDRAVRGLDSASNVAVQTVPETPADPVVAMAVTASAWREAARRSSIYTVVAVDPIAPVVAQWAARLTGRSDELEVAIGLVGDLATPDYYLVGPTLPDPEVHWYTAHLRALAPNRVVVCEVTPPALIRTLAELPFGRPLPPLAELASSARSYVPAPDFGPYRDR